MPDLPKLPVHEPPEPELPHGLPMPPNTGEIPPPTLPPAPEEDPAPPGKEPKADIDEMSGLPTFTIVSKGRAAGQSASEEVETLFGSKLRLLGHRASKIGLNH